MRSSATVRLFRVVRIIFAASNYMVFFLNSLRVVVISVWAAVLVIVILVVRSNI